MNALSKQFVSLADLEEGASGTPSGLTFLNYSQMCELPDPTWLVEGQIQERTAVLLFGKSNAYKSFCAIDIGLSIATGMTWHGSQAGCGQVLFVATEGANSVGRRRIPAWFDHYSVSLGDA